MNTRVKLTNDFYLHEFLKSETAARLGRKLEPDAVVIANITRLCTDVLQPLRDDIGVTMVISSGWRPVWLNTIVKGSKNSQHITGQAANVNAVGMTPFELCSRAVELKLPFDQVILEFDDWMHISVPDAGKEPRRQILTARIMDADKDGDVEVTYLNGLIEA